MNGPVPMIAFFFAPVLASVISVNGSKSLIFFGSAFDQMCFGRIGMYSDDIRTFGSASVIFTVRSSTFSILSTDGR